MTNSPTPTSPHTPTFIFTSLHRDFYYDPANMPRRRVSHSFPVTVWYDDPQSYKPLSIEDITAEVTL